MVTLSLGVEVHMVPKMDTDFRRFDDQPGVQTTSLARAAFEMWCISQMVLSQAKISRNKYLDDALVHLEALANEHPNPHIRTVAGEAFTNTLNRLETAVV